MCCQYDDQLVRQAILRELDRGGQVFFVHNRVQGIEQMADKLARSCPRPRSAWATARWTSTSLNR